MSPAGDGEMWSPETAERTSKQFEERFRYARRGGVWVVREALNYQAISTPPKDLVALSMYDQIKVVRV